MSRGWENSRLTIGEELRIPSALFIEPDKAINRLVSTKYVGESDSGILVECAFKSGTSPNISRIHQYKIFINWASIWCGQVKVYTESGQPVRAYREQGMPVIETVQQVDDE